MSDYVPNNELAEKYFRIVSICCLDRTTYRAIKLKIADVEMNIHRLYEENNRSLRNLEINGIGAKTKEVLELILSEGEVKAAEITRERAIEQREKRMQQRDNISVGFNPHRERSLMIRSRR